MVDALFPLEVKGAIARRRGKVLVGPIDLSWSGGETCVVIGPNGSGKTTLLKLLHGTERLRGGSVAWACGEESARDALAFVFQRPILLRRSVGENIAYPLLLKSIPRAEARDKARDWAKRVGLDAMFDRPAHGLSGGEQQKLAIARALIAAPQVLFLDEPCASLDGRATREIEAILMDAKAEGTRLILSTHDLGQAKRLGERVLFLLGGQIHEAAAADAFFAGPQTTQAQAFLNGDIVE